MLPEEEQAELQVQGRSLKSGNRKGVRMEERSCGGGWACILVTQGSVGRNVKYCGFQATCGFWKQVCDRGTMVAGIQRSKCPTDAIKEKVLEL